MEIATNSFSSSYTQGNKDKGKRRKGRDVDRLFIRQRHHEWDMSTAPHFPRYSSIFGRYRITFLHLIVSINSSVLWSHIELNVTSSIITFHIQVLSCRSIWPRVDIFTDKRFIYAHKRIQTLAKLNVLLFACLITRPVIAILKYSNICRYFVVRLLRLIKY